MEISKEESKNEIIDSAPVATPKKRGNFNLWQVLVIFVVVILAVSAAVYYIFIGPRFVRESNWQAVFLTNGQVYFGNIVKENNRDVYLKDIYYLQVSSPLQQDGQPAPRGELSLVKLGNELHGPTDLMIINRDHVLFTEDLRDDGKVVEAILRHRAGGGN